ncbi:MAG: hypothetical protein ACYCY9_12455 [Thiobacillus sp.]
MKTVCVALSLSFFAMNPLWAADRYAAVTPSVAGALSSGTSGFSYTVADAGPLRDAFGGIDRRDAKAPSAPKHDTVEGAPSPEHHDAWMTLLAGVGLAGMLVSRARRRMY